MALARLTRHCIPLMCQKASYYINKSPLGKLQRNFGLGQVRLDKSTKKLDQIRVDGLSKIALVIDKQYKSINDVPPFLSYGQVYKARDRFRVKASIASGIFIIFLMIYLIKNAQSNKRREEFEGMRAVEAAKHK